MAKIVDIPGGNTRKHHVLIADVAHLRIRKDRAVRARIITRIGMWHIEGSQDQRLQHTQDDDICGFSI